MPQPVKFYIFLVIAVVVLFVVGAFMSQQSAEIEGCRASWYVYLKNVKSDLCPDPNVECAAEPYKQQHNALVDMLLCACEKAGAGGEYKNGALNQKIVDSYYQMTGAKLSVEEICGGSALMKWKY